MWWQTAASAHTSAAASGLAAGGDRGVDVLGGAVHGREALTREPAPGPRSDSSGMPSAVNSTLAGVTSPCTSPRLWAAASACASGAPIVTTSPGSSEPRRPAASPASRPRRGRGRGRRRAGADDLAQPHDVGRVEAAQQRRLAAQRVDRRRGRRRALSRSARPVSPVGLLRSPPDHAGPRPKPHAGPARRSGPDPDLASPAGASQTSTAGPVLPTRLPGCRRWSSWRRAGRVLACDGHLQRAASRSPCGGGADVRRRPRPHRRRRRMLLGPAASRCTTPATPRRSWVLDHEAQAPAAPSPPGRSSASATAAPRRRPLARHDLGVPSLDGADRAR
jgi:hypothetical protein